MEENPYVKSQIIHLKPLVYIYFLLGFWAKFHLAVIPLKCLLCNCDLKHQLSHHSVLRASLLVITRDPRVRKKFSTDSCILRISDDRSASLVPAWKYKFRKTKDLALSPLWSIGQSLLIEVSEETQRCQWNIASDSG